MSQHTSSTLTFAILFILFVLNISSCIHEPLTQDCGGKEVPAHWPCETQTTACGELIYGPPFSTDTISCLYITACGETIVGEPVDTISCLSSCAADTLYYESDIVPILLNNGCIGCHTTANNYRGVVLTSYSKLISSNILEAGNPDNSDIIDVITSSNTQERMPPTPDPAVSDNDVAILKEWIRQGAKNLPCDMGGCDTTNVGYTSTIRPILNNRCVSCHREGSNPEGGVILNTYAGVKEATENGTLLGSVAKWPDFEPMPPLNKPNLPQCDIIKIKTWITNGYQQN